MSTSSSFAYAASFVAANVSALLLARWMQGRRSPTPDKPMPGPALNLHGSTTVSAPGKALIAGGYLVLEAPNCGVTVSSTSRFYTTIKTLPPPSTHTPAPAHAHATPTLSIRVDSPQFRTHFLYTYDPATETLRQAGPRGNDFVDKCLRCVCGGECGGGVCACLFVCLGVCLGVLASGWREYCVCDGMMLK